MYRVLIADDEQFVIRGLKRRIDWKKLGCEVVGSAEDGDEAFRLACELRPDIIITDIKMPGRSGLQLIQGLKGIVPAGIYYVAVRIQNLNMPEKHWDLKLWIIW